MTPANPHDTTFRSIMVNALFFLYHGCNLLPVVEPNSHILAGAVSTWDVLGRITTQP
jgi:hypothetical protein